MGETGIFPVEGGVVIILLTMPTTIGENGTLNSTMKSTSSNDGSGDGSNGDKKYGDKVRDQMDTKDLGAIMSRFFSAVSWKNK